MQRAQREAQERECQRREQAAARIADLDSLAGREDELGSRVETLVATKGQAEYAEVSRLLTDRRDLAARQQEAEDFQALLVDLSARHGRKLSFPDQLQSCGPAARPSHPIGPASYPRARSGAVQCLRPHLS